MVKEEESVKIIKAMSNVLFELQISLEPIRDKALDEKARLTGYAQCAEQMIKIIVSKAEELKKQALEKESIKEEDQVKEKQEAPLIIEEKELEKKKKGV